MFHKLVKKSINEIKVLDGLVDASNGGGFTRPCETASPSRIF